MFFRFYKHQTWALLYLPRYIVLGQYSKTTVSHLPVQPSLSISELLYTSITTTHVRPHPANDPFNLLLNFFFFFATI